MNTDEIGVYPCIRGSYSSLNALDDHRNALPTADARSRQTIAFATAVQLVQHRQNETRTSRAQRVPERDRATVDVRSAAIESQLLLDSQVLTGKSLIYFDHVDVVQ